MNSGTIKIVGPLVVAAAILQFAITRAAHGADLVRGEKVYQNWCASCHDAGIGNPGLSRKPGTDALQAKYEGLVAALLVARTDLTPQFVALFVRQGVTVMPFFRKTEINDQDLADLGAYLSRNNSELASPAR